MYGYQWESRMGEAVDANGQLTDTAAFWSGSLSDYSLDEIKTGLAAVLIAGNEFPPSLPIFRKLCRPVDEINVLTKRVRQAEADRKRGLPAPGQTTTREDAHRHLGAIRNKLRGRHETG